VGVTPWEKWGVIAQNEEIPSLFAAFKKRAFEVPQATCERKPKPKGVKSQGCP